MQQEQHDILIIGSGAAGLAMALRLADQYRVAVVSKETLPEASSLYAQGGISAVLDENDSIENHVQDTLEAGAGLCEEATVRLVAENAPDCISWLLSNDVDLTREPPSNGIANLHLHREGGHSHRRIVHAADATGRAIETRLETLARNHTNIDVFEHHIAIDLITAAKMRRSDMLCYGAYVLDKQSGEIRVFAARSTILATGGASKVYLYTSNPDTATGDGIAMAWRAGCRVANLEFNQFHPTCLFHPHAKSFLLSEALRGEGGKLLLPDGTRFMQNFDEREELAPRDIVARAIDHEMKRLGIDSVFLDMTHKSRDYLEQHFPTIYRRCLELGLDMSSQPIPVVPAAHYTCGGVVTDLNGKTDIENLYAIGEVAYTGLHGANRLASNSLLECLVFAKAAAQQILETDLSRYPLPKLPDWDASRVTDSDEHVVVSHNWDEIRRVMWDYVGIVRTTKRLERAKHRVDLLLREIHEYYGNFTVTSDLVELRNLVVVADLIIRCALLRRESRGLHYSLDYPSANLPPAPTILSPELAVFSYRKKQTIF